MRVGLVPLGEFKRTIKATTGVGLQIGAQETDEGFIVIAHNLDTGMRFTVRHAAKPEPRTWRLDRLSLWLKQCGVKSMEVRHQREEV
jgi:hypothetical protein